MNMKRVLWSIVLSGIMVISTTAAIAAPVYWTDWTSASTNVVTGTLDIGLNTVGVTSSGAYSFAQTSGGTNYWNPSSPYISPTVDNAPPASDIIALSTGGTITITFSESVKDPLIALVSWNGNTVDFGVPINILSYGQGYWGNGTPMLNPGATGFFGSGEVHGVIQLPGTYTSISFTHTTENWHGFTIGAADLAPTPVPVPAAIWLLGSGLFGLAGLKKKIRI